MITTRRLVAWIALAAFTATAHAQFGLENLPGPGGPPPPPSRAAPLAGADSFVITMDQGSGAAFRDLIPSIEAQAKAQGKAVHANTFLLVADVSHQMVQVQAEGSVHAPTWDAEAKALQEAGDTANLRRHQETVRAWEGRFVSYEHHGPVASLEAKAQNMPNAASMIMRDWEPLTRSLKARYQQAIASGGPPPNIGIVIHGFSDADAISSKMLMEEVAARMTGRTPLGTPIDPILENLALVQARNADMGTLGKQGMSIHRTLEGALEGVNYEIESQVSRRSDLTPEQRAELKSRLQVEATTEFMNKFKEVVRAELYPGMSDEAIRRVPLEQRIPEAALADLVDRTKAELARTGSPSRHAELHRRGAERAQRYGQEVAESMRLAAERPGEVIRSPSNEFVKSASMQEVWVETSAGGMKKTMMLTVEISQPPISKAAFWTAYNSTSGGAHPPAEVVLIKGEGFVNWFAGTKRGMSLKGVTAPLADAKPAGEGGKFMHRGRHGNWTQNFPAFKGAAYDWAISLGSIDFKASGADIHGLGREIASEGQRLAEAGGHTRRARPGGVPDVASRVPTENQAAHVRAAREAANRLVQEAARVGFQDPARGRAMYESAQEMLRTPERFPIERILKMPGVREMPTNERESLRRLHEQRVREATPPARRGRPGGGRRFRGRI